MNELLIRAVKARIPLIHVTCDDPLYYKKVLAYVLEGVAGVEEAPKNWNGPTYDPPSGTYYITMSTWTWDWIDRYREFASCNSVGIAINMENPPGVFMEAGPLVAPRSYIAKHLHARVEASELNSILDALSGLNTKTCLEVCQMVFSEDGYITPEAISNTRQLMAPPTTGLHPVNLDDPYHVPNPDVSAWLERNKGLLFTNGPSILRPRGLLFHGPAGTGKTMAAKHIARESGCKLFLLDVGGLLSRYVGQSESALREALRAAESMSPCILLLDEVEKLFVESTDSGVTSRLLSMLLWWLQEHKAPVITIMTSNSTDALPPELIRPGRVDSMMYFDLLTKDQAIELARSIMKQLQERHNIPSYEFDESVIPNGMSHAQAAELALDAARDFYLDTS